MKRAIKEFIKEVIRFPRHYYSSDQIKSIISSTQALKETFTNPKFKVLVFSPKSPLTVYVRKQIIYEVLKQNFDEFFNLRADYFINSIFTLENIDWKDFDPQTRQKCIDRILEIIKNKELKKNRIIIALNRGSIIFEFNANEINEILLYFADNCQTLTITEEFLKIISLLPIDSFKKILYNSTMKIRHNSNIREQFENLSSNYRDIILQSILNKKIINPTDILISKKIKKEWFDINSKTLVEMLEEWNLRIIIRDRRDLQQKQKSSFVLESAKKTNNIDIIKCLSKDDLLEYSKGLSYSKKTLWSQLLRNEYIYNCPDIFERAFISCLYLANLPVLERQLEIPDKFLEKLTLNQVKHLVKKDVNNKGEFISFRFNPDIIKNKLTPLIISEPEYYKKYIAGKLSACLEKYKTGRSACNVICDYLGLEVQADDWYERKEEKSLIKRATEKILSLSTDELKSQSFMFLIDVLLGKDWQEMELEYKNLANHIRTL